MVRKIKQPSKELMEAKLTEAVFTLLQLKPDLGSVFFDFTELWKINLEEFMNKSYKCDLSIEEFAHYTGRSLSTFKKEYKTVICRNIVQKHGFSRCTGCCFHIGDKVAELLQRENAQIGRVRTLRWNDFDND